MTTPAAGLGHVGRARMTARIGAAHAAPPPSDSAQFLMRDRQAFEEAGDDPLVDLGTAEVTGSRRRRGAC